VEAESISRGYRGSRKHILDLLEQKGFIGVFNIASLTPQRTVISVKNDKGELIALSQALAYIKQPEKIK
jgi:hypothetical protein